MTDPTTARTVTDRLAEALWRAHLVMIDVDNADVREWRLVDRDARADWEWKADIIAEQTAKVGLKIEVSDD